MANLLPQEKEGKINMLETFSLLAMFFTGAVAGFSFSQAMIEDRRKQERAAARLMRGANGKARRLFDKD